METRRTDVALASALSALVAVAASLLALAVREVFFGGVLVGDLDSALIHFTIVAALFVWPPLTVMVFLIGIARASDDRVMRTHTAGRTGVAIGAALGSLGLAAFWLLVYGVGFLEALAWAVIGAGIGALSGFLFDRIAFGARRVA